MDKHVKNKILKNGQRAKHVPSLLQMEVTECGAVSLQMICAYYGLWLSPEKVRGDCAISRDGARASFILKAARKYGFKAGARAMDAEELCERVNFPCICHWDFNHFLVVTGIKHNKVYINDPAHGKLKLSLDEFKEHFTGIVIKLNPTEDFEPHGSRTKMRTFFNNRMKGFYLSLLSVVALFVIGIIVSISNPFLSQMFINKVIPSFYGSGIKGAFYLLFIILAILQIVFSVYKSKYLLKLEGKMIGASMPHFIIKVLHLPIIFFEQRRVPDIVSRAKLNITVSQRIISQITPLVITIAMMIVFFVLMVSYSLVLGLIALLVAALKIICVMWLSKKRTDTIRVQMKDTASLYTCTTGAVSSIESIKSSGSEHSIFVKWAGYQAAANNNKTKLGLSQTYLDSIPSFLSSFADMVVIVLGAYLIMVGQFDIGMVSAMQGFVSQFMAPVDSLAQSATIIEQTRADMERIQDVMNYEEDPLSAEPDTIQAIDKDKLSGEVEFRDVTFGYTKLVAPLVDKCSFSIKPGEMVAFVGGSGSGKSTLAKLACGLVLPWDGDILYDGKSIQDINKLTRCTSISVINQNITLFDDTIKNNVTLWDEFISDKRINKALEDANISEDLSSYHDPLNHVMTEGGKDLSGGQRQRLEIARALAVDPTILIMDEATSALDSATEFNVIQAIKARKITTIMVAHRLSAIRDCDKIYVLDKGSIIASGTHDELIKDKDGLYYRLVTQE